MRITFFGDVMCEPSVLKGAKRGKTYHFDYVFDQVRDYMAQSDFIIGNLETPMAGAEAGFTDDWACFNAPDTYADAMKRAGFKLLSTANNHTFDRGYAGLVSTIRYLDEKGIPHTGTWLPGAPRQEAAYFTVGDTKVAVIAYTYNTNYDSSGKKCAAVGEWEGTVNLLRPQTESCFLKGSLRGMSRFDRLTKRFLKYYTRCRIKKFFGATYSYPRPDHHLDMETVQPYVDKFQRDIRTAKEKADVVIFYPHIGGQFDPHPGAITEYVVETAVEAGADAVVASHAHVVQNAAVLEGVPCAYSIGNFNMDPTSALVVPEYLPGWGLAWHLDVEHGKLKKVSFSILVTEKEGKAPITRLLTDRMAAARPKKQAQLRRYTRQIYETVTRKPLEEPWVREEYVFWEATHE